LKGSNEGDNAEAAGELGKMIPEAKNYQLVENELAFSVLLLSVAT
jgi:hypothetical protein